jgi:tetratricopeptide (TPR) repeat protein
LGRIALQLMELGRPDEAAKAAAKAVARDPMDARLHRARSLALLQLGDLERAETSIRTAIGLEASPQPHMHRLHALLLLLLDRLTESADASLRATAAGPPGADSIGQSLVMSLRPGASASDAPRAMALAGQAGGDPTLVAWQSYALGMAHALTEAWEPALAAIRKGMLERQMRGSEALGFVLLAHVQARMGDLAGARATLQGMPATSEWGAEPSPLEERLVAETRARLAAAPR